MDSQDRFLGLHLRTMMFELLAAWSAILLFCDQLRGTDLGSQTCSTYLPEACAPKRAKASDSVDYVSGSVPAPRPSLPIMGWSSSRPSSPLQAVPSPAQSTSEQAFTFPASGLVEGDPHLSYLLPIPNSQEYVSRAAGRQGRGRN